MVNLTERELKAAKGASGGGVTRASDSELLHEQKTRSQK